MHLDTVADVTAIAGLLLVGVGLWLQWITLRHDHWRRRAESTLHAYFGNHSRRVDLRSDAAARLGGMFDGQNLPDDFAVALANATGDDLAETRRAVNRYLNHYEHLAAGVNADVLDFEILRRVSQRSLIAIYRKFEPYVIARRVATGRLQMFCEFQQLAERLASESTPG